MEVCAGGLRPGASRPGAEERDALGFRSHTSTQPSSIEEEG
jgi:hypothetical protein